MQSGTDVEDQAAPQGDVQEEGMMAAWEEATVFDAVQAPGRLSLGTGLEDGEDEASRLTAPGYQAWLEEMRVADARAWELWY